MVFKRMLGAFGVGAPSVDTVLTSHRVLPGGMLSGEIRLTGGDFDADIEHITLGLVARVEIEHGDGEAAGVGEFSRARISGPFTLAKGENRSIPFQIPVPWETPISQIAGQHLSGMALGVRTELAIAKAVDKGDLDEVAVEPLPSQLRILQALLDLGFHFKSADLEAGHLYGVHQELPFYQEIEFYPPSQHHGLVGEVEVTFVTSPHGLEVILEADKRAGRYSGDAIGRFTVSHDDAMRTDWPSEIDRWLSSLTSYGQHGYGGHHAAPYGHDGHGHYDHHDSHHGHHDHHGHHGSGPGWGAVAAAGAAGVVGGLVAGEIVEEIFEDEEEGEEDD